jgi:hypothetical protein
MQYIALTAGSRHSTRCDSHWSLVVLKDVATVVVSACDEHLYAGTADRIGRGMANAVPRKDTIPIPHTSAVQLSAKGTSAFPRLNHGQYISNARLMNPATMGTAMEVPIAATGINRVPSAFRDMVTTGF